MSLNILNSTVIRISKIPEWCKTNVGFKPNRSTVFRWTKRGAKGRKLKTFSVGGRKCTTVEALLEFFTDDESETAPSLMSTTDSEAFLESEGL